MLLAADIRNVRYAIRMSPVTVLTGLQESNVQRRFLNITHFAYFHFSTSFESHNCISTRLLYIMHKAEYLF